MVLVKKKVYVQYHTINSSIQMFFNLRSGDCISINQVVLINIQGNIQVPFCYITPPNVLCIECQFTKQASSEMLIHINDFRPEIINYIVKGSLVSPIRSGTVYLPA